MILLARTPESAFWQAHLQTPTLWDRFDKQVNKMTDLNLGHTEFWGVVGDLRLPTPGVHASNYNGASGGGVQASATVRSPQWLQCVAKDGTQAFEDSKYF